MTDERKILNEFRRLNHLLEQFVEMYSIKAESELGLKQIELSEKMEKTQLKSRDLDQMLNDADTYKDMTITKTDRLAIRTVLDDLNKKRKGGFIS